MVKEKSKFDSQEEQYFDIYLKMLKEKGYIEKYVHQPNSFILNDPLYAKTDWGKKEKTLFQGITYKPDFKIFWTEKAIDVFVCHTSLIKKEIPFYTPHKEKGQLVSTVDIKGGFFRHGAHKIFYILQKWVHQKHGIYVQKITISNNKNGIFYKTFTPTEYLLTPTGRERKIHYEPRSLSVYLSLRG